jgi:Rrf2 family transcriptional regulator, nitric oxide-sensitive transcriptional repressor
LRLTKRSNLAVRLLMFCGTNADRLVTKHEAALACNSSVNHMAQVINRLGQLGYLTTVRGRRGGVRLALEMSEIRIGQIFRALEGEVAENDCFADNDNTCPLTGICALRGALRKAVESFYSQLDEVTLDKLVCGNTALFELFNPAAVQGCQRN